MKVKFGAIIVDGRGKIGGHVLTKNRAGAVMRTKVTPVNVNSVDQLSARARFTVFSQSWRGLTEVQRDAWNAAVQDFQSTDIFGDLKTPTGFNLFQRLNNNLQNIGKPTLTLPPAPLAVDAVQITSVNAAAAIEALSVIHSTPVPAGISLKVFATSAQSAGKSFIKSEFRQIDVIAAAAISPYDALAAYNAKFGTISNVGSKIFIRFVPVNDTTGQEGAASQLSGIIAA